VNPDAADARLWALGLFRRSVLKQRKLAELQAMLGPTTGLRCLDLGSDNGVVSLLLRERGGSWASGDLTEEAVASIRELVGEDVHEVDGARLPFADGEFDAVAVVDMLEHVPDEPAFVSELARVLKPGGRLVINTPHDKRSALRRLRHALGQTDEKHGHLRPGYTPEMLGELLQGRYIETHHTYSLLLRARRHCHQPRRGAPGKKGPAKEWCNPGDLTRHRKVFVTIPPSPVRLGILELGHVVPRVDAC
jgi:SAM-dependent methyltransferase